MSDPAKADRERRKLLDDETLVLCVGCDEAKRCDDEHVCDDCRLQAERDEMKARHHARMTGGNE